MRWSCAFISHSWRTAAKFSFFRWSANMFESKLVDASMSGVKVCIVLLFVLRINRASFVFALSSLRLVCSSDRGQIVMELQEELTTTNQSNLIFYLYFALLFHILLFTTRCFVLPRYGPRFVWVFAGSVESAHIYHFQQMRCVNNRYRDN